MDTADRYERGLEKLKEVDSKKGEWVIESLKDSAPELAKYGIEFPFGDIYSQPSLDLRSLEVGTVAELTALGYASPELKVHIHGALKIGCTRREEFDVTAEITVHPGFPTALHGAFAAKEVSCRTRC